MTKGKVRLLQLGLYTIAVLVQPCQGKGMQTFVLLYVHSRADWSSQPQHAEVTSSQPKSADHAVLDVSMPKKPCNKISMRDCVEHHICKQAWPLQ